MHGCNNIPVIGAAFAAAQRLTMRQMLVEAKVKPTAAAHLPLRRTPQHPFPPLSNCTIAGRQLTAVDWKRNKVCISATIRLLPAKPIRPSLPSGCRSRRWKAADVATTNGGVEATLPPERIPGASFRHGHTVGILGGSSTAATVEFLRRLVAATPENDHIPLLMCSNPSNYPATRGIESEAEWREPLNRPTNEARWKGHPTSHSVTHVGKTEVESKEGSCLAALLDGRRFLEEAGAKCIVIPCHLSYIWYKQVSSEGCVPILNMADSVAKELKAADLSPLEAGSRRPKIGILSTQPILAAGFYQQIFHNQGFDVALPDKATMEHTVIPGIRALRRHDMEGARNLLRIAVQVLLVNAVNVVVLACHDMCTAFSPDDPLLKRCIDPVDSLVRATVKWAHTAKGVTQ
ncbi:hypothetical protein O6H91_Y007300 [Diphasiastrum complanatum]|nr:hypothetical protein O6H91_Y358300 [Diphasiastrum complanatum]KAJ7298269.1 hypothetical protein O6H91_Y007300 [Diphasiastrum complanatum]